MKHVNVNLSGTNFLFPVLSDGKPLVNSVDQFPVSDKSLYKRDGWPMSDIGILERYSRDSNISQAEIDSIARRLEYIKSEPSNNKSDEELLRTLRPAWVQTASEFKDYESMLFRTTTVTDSPVADSPEKEKSVADTKPASQATPAQSAE